MSRDAGGPELPRRPGSSPKRPKPPADGRREETGAWQPNPNKGAKKRASTSEPAEPPRGPSWGERILFGRVGTAQLAVYCRQFAAYLNAGVDISKTLSSLEAQFARTALGPVTTRLLVAVRHGDSLNEAMGREPQAFDSLFLSMIKVAEARGGIPETLQRMAVHYESRLSLIRQARSAMIYPILVLVVAAAAVTLFTVWILPMLLGLLQEIAGRGALPLPSRMLMAFSRFISLMGWWLLPLLLVVVPVLAVQTYRTKLGKRVIDEVALYVPVLGQLLRKIDTTRFSRTLGTLTASGVDVGTSLDLTADVMQLEPFRRAVRATRVEVMEGEEISVALNQTRRFSPDVIAIVNSGEETGKLPEALERLADDYEEQVTYMVRNLAQLIQPILLLLLGGLVLFVILAVLLPYIALLGKLSGG